MIKILLMLSLFSFVSFFQINSCNKKVVVTEHNSDKSITEKFLTVSELNEKNPSKGIFETKGFVSKIYTCPPCPPDAQCKPCMADNIIISEENKSLENYDLTEKEMIIFAEKAKTFSKGKEYKFKVKITGGKTTSANLNDTELISSELIKN